MVVFTRTINNPVVQETIEDFLTRRKGFFPDLNSFPDFSGAGEIGVIIFLIFLVLLAFLIILLIHLYLTSTRFFVDERGIGLPSKPMSCLFRKGNVLVRFSEIERIETTLDQTGGAEIEVWYGYASPLRIDQMYLPAEDRDTLLRFFLSRKDLRARMTIVQRRTASGGWFKKEQFTQMTLTELEDHLWMSVPSRTELSWAKDGKIFTSG
jgi:hypothetical protein